MLEVYIILCFFTALFWQKIFEKAGVKRWKALVPFYCDYIRFKMADRGWLYFLYLIFSSVHTVVWFVFYSLSSIEFDKEALTEIEVTNDLIVLFVICFVFSIIVFVMNSIMGIRIAAKFGKKKLFGVGLGLIPLIFAPILAFDNARYSKKI